MRERAVLKADEAREHTEYVACFAPALEFSVGNFAGVGRKAEIQHIDVVDVPIGMAQADYIAGTAAAGLQCFDGVLDAARGEVAQKGIAGAERQKAQSGRRVGERFGEEAIHNFVRGTVTADRQEISEALRIGGARKHGGFAAGARVGYFEINAELPHALEGSRREGAATSATCGGIDDGEETCGRSWLGKLRSGVRGRVHRGTTASRPTAPRICSASSARFTFMDAVRGKSLFQMR